MASENKFKAHLLWRIDETQNWENPQRIAAYGDARGSARGTQRAFQEILWKCLFAQGSSRSEAESWNVVRPEAT